MTDDDRTMQELTLEELNRLASDYITNTLGIAENLTVTALAAAGSPLRYQATTIRKLVVKRLRLQNRAGVGAAAIAADAQRYAALAAEGRQAGTLHILAAPLQELASWDARIRELDEVLVELVEDLQEAAGALEVQERERRKLEGGKQEGAPTPAP